ncbi:hypothetical protein HQ587_00055 [bacterium]|nr:hypothetical protein [bacterium]
MDEVRKYRANDLRKLKIQLTGFEDYDFEARMRFGFEIEDVSSKRKYLHTFTVLKDTNQNVNDLVESGIDQMFNCMYDIILNDDWERGQHDPSTGLITCEHEDYNDKDPYAIRVSPRPERGFKYNLTPQNLIRQSKIAQQAILNTLFIKQFPVPRVWLVVESYMPEDIMWNEIKILTDLSLIKQMEHELEINAEVFNFDDPNEPASLMDKDYHIRLTAKGRERFERLHTGFGRYVFIIIWCELKWLAKFFKEAVKEAGYEGYIQEYEEPPSEIGSEIKERIENCAFVIADLTGGRENCLYELGYAHALHKRTIITRRKEDAEVKTKDDKTVLKLTFDINQYKHSFWKDENDKEFEEAIKERIQQTIKSIEQDYFTI